MIDFIRDTINLDNPVIDIPKHIAEVSVMYRLFAGKPDVDIYASTKDGVIGFSVLSEKEDDACNLKKMLNGSHYTAYGSTFMIQARVHKNTVHIAMNKEGS